MRIDILTFDGCPNAATALKNVRQALQMERVDAAVHLVNIATAEAAKRAHFLGSPSIRIDGEDIEVDARDRIAFGLMCRTYDCDGSVVGSPSIAMIRASIQRHAS